jgi:hypothetical protein
MSLPDPNAPARLDSDVVVDPSTGLTHGQIFGDGRRTANSDAFWADEFERDVSTGPTDISPDRPL